MTSKLTVYIDDSIRRVLNDAASNRSISEIVNEALESYLAPSLIGDLPTFRGDLALPDELPSISEVKRKRPKVRGSSANILANQRRGRNERISR